MVSELNEAIAPSPPKEAAAATKTAPAAAAKKGKLSRGRRSGQTTFSVRFSGRTRDGEGVPEILRRRLLLLPRAGDGVGETERDDAQREREAAPLGAQPRSGILKPGGAPHYELRAGGVPRNQKNGGGAPLRAARWWGTPQPENGGGAPLRAARWWGTPQPKKRRGRPTASCALVGYPRNRKTEGAMTLIDRMQELLEAERAGSNPSTRWRTARRTWEEGAVHPFRNEEGKFCAGLFGFLQARARSPRQTSARSRTRCSPCRRRPSRSRSSSRGSRGSSARSTRFLRGDERRGEGVLRRHAGSARRQYRKVQETRIIAADGVFSPPVIKEGPMHIGAWKDVEGRRSPRRGPAASRSAS